MYVFICGGHHDSDRIAVLVMASKAESIVFCKSYCIMYNCLNKDFIHSFIHSVQWVGIMSSIHIYVVLVSDLSSPITHLFRRLSASRQKDTYPCF